MIYRPIVIDEEIRFSKKKFIVSKTDIKGNIVFINKNFCDISGYSEDELIGSPHNIIRHPDMPKIIFKLLWERIQKKEEIFAYVKNLSQDGGFYWVFANVTATLDENNNIRDFHSVRRKPSQKAMQIIPSLYKELLEAEKKGTTEASYRELNKILDKKGATYDEFILSLQQ